MTFHDLASGVRAEIGQEHRYRHSVCVARCADLLAQRHGEDPRKARLAGMLHDLARLYPPERLIAECEARSIPIDAFSRERPTLLHAPLGAAIARERFGVRDEAVLSAIRKHTSGAGDMTALDCIVFLADGVGGRTYEGVEAMWQLALRDLRAAMREMLRMTFVHLAEKGREPAPDLLAAAKTFGATADGARAGRGVVIRELIDVVRDAALDKKGEDFIVLDVSGRTILADTFAVVTGRSKIQTRAIADAISDAVEAGGRRVARVEGYAEGSWILVDLGNAIVHVFTPEQRAFYNLERLWSNAEKRQEKSS